VKKEENTPATMASCVTRALARRLAKRRKRVALRADERVELEWFSLERMQEKIKARGVMQMRASW
jgi:hypothetical protein